MPTNDSHADLTWGHSTVETACPLDCPDSCSLAVTVQNGRIVTIDGSPRQPVTGGYICAKVRRFGDRVYGEARLRHPAVRKGPKGKAAFRPVSWDEALDLIATRMTEIRDRWGAEAILPFSYGGSNGLVSQDTADLDLFWGFGTARLNRTVCAAPTSTAASAMYGKMAGVGYADYPEARLIVVWGANPSVSGVHLVPYIQQAQKAGASLVVLDPRRTRLARRADLHLAVRPGTDLPVALALHRFLFEEGKADDGFLARHARGADRLRTRAQDWTFERAAEVAGVQPEAIRAFAELYAERSPAVIRCGWGIERNRNGGSAAAAILALPAVAGKFGVRGGGYTMSNSGVWALRPDEWRQAEEPRTRIVNMNHLGRELLGENGHAVRMLFVYNCNPAVTMPEQTKVLKGLEREDLFTVVFDQVMTDTAAFADVILPATTFLETYDLARGYGAMSLQLVRPTIEAVGDSKPNVQVFWELAERLGLPTRDEFDSDAAAVIKVLGGVPSDARSQILDDRAAAPPFGPAPVQFDDVLPRTSDQRVDLFPERLHEEAPGGLYHYQADPSTERFPLALISPASDRTISSTLGELHETLASIQMHPSDAAVRGLEHGSHVKVFNDLGQVECAVAITDEVRSGTISLPKGLWRRHTYNGATANALAPDSLTDLGGGACFNDARVEVVKAVALQWQSQALSISIVSDPTRPST